MSNHRAILFDMDGVLIDSEREWERSGAEFVTGLYGAELLARMGDRMGLSLEAEYALARSLGFDLDRESFDAAYDLQAAHIYAKAPLTAGIDEALEDLDGLGYRIGLVTSSRPRWVATVLGRLRVPERFSCVLSLGARPDLRSKPAPDSYLAAMAELAAGPASVIVVEDSNNGIRAGVAAGARVIGYQEHLPPGYAQLGTAWTAATMADVVAIARSLAER